MKTRILNPEFAAAAKTYSDKFLFERVASNVSTGFLKQDTDEATHYLLNEMNERGYAAAGVVGLFFHIMNGAPQNTYRFTAGQIKTVLQLSNYNRADRLTDKSAEILAQNFMSASIK